MTQDEIIKIYKEVKNKLCDGKEWCWAGVGEPLQMFAKLVAEHEAQRTWVGLTDADRLELAAAQHGWEDLLIAAETKLKEKNA
jgi:hypothetical protein